MDSENKSLNSISNKDLKVKNQKQLRIKLTKLANSHFNPRCDHFINNMRSLNFRILESSGGKKSIDKEVRESRNFRFGKVNDYFIHFTDLSPYQIELKPFIKDLKNQFTKEEINIIRKNKDYYIQNDIIKDNASIFNDQKLYQILNTEEKEEKEELEMKENNNRVFHNLNYFNKKRKGVLLGLNNSINSGNNSLNKSIKSDRNNGSALYKTSVNIINEKNVKDIENKNKLTYNLENLSHDYLIKNKLDIIENEIKKGVIRRKKEDEKIFLKKEERQRIFIDFEKKSQKEIKQYLEQSKEYINANEINLFKSRLKINKNNRRNETFFPRINENQTFSKIKNPNSFNDNFLSLHDKIPNLRGNSSNNIKENQINMHRNSSISKKIEHNKIKEEKDQYFIKDINKRIKSIYESFKFHNKL